jgi:hypothetical protein
VKKVSPSRYVWPLVLAAALSADRRAALAEKEAATTMQPQAHPAIPVATVQELIRFRIVELGDGPRVVTASKWSGKEHGEIVDRGTRWRSYTVDRGSGRAHKEREATEESSAHDFDIAVSDDAVFWLLERNVPKPLEAIVLRARPTAANIIPPSDDGEATWIEIPTAREAEVKVRTPWHTMMPEPQWLFAARARVSHGSDWWVTCDSLDGKILRMRGPGQLPPDAGLSIRRWGEPRVSAWKEVGFGPLGLYPVLVEGHTAYLMAYVQTPLARDLYWALGNYNGHKPEGDPRGTLTVQRIGADAGTVSLASLGPVAAFDLDQGADGTLYLAALHEAQKKTEVVLQISADEGKTWQIAGAVEAPRTVDQVAVRATRKGDVWVGFAFRDGETSVIKVVPFDHARRPAR